MYSTYEVLGCLGNILTKEAEDDSSFLASLNLDIEENFVGDSLSVAITKKERFGM